MNQEHPNIVVLLMDTARADRFSCYGNTRNATPFLDSLMKEGTLYQEAYSTSIWSLPAYTSLFTGKLPSTHGVTSWVPEAQNDLVKRINDQYRSLCISPHVMGGGWGLIDGFDHQERVEVPHKAPLFGPDPVLEEMRGKDPSATDFLGLMKKHRSVRTIPNALNQLLKKKVKYRLGFWDDSGARNTIESAKKAVSQTDEPFFLFANFVESHMPIFLPRQWALKYTNQSISEINDINNVDLFDATFGGRNLIEDEERLLVDLHDASLAYQDTMIEEFYDHLVSEGLAENTVFMFLSDHGNLFGERGVWGHHAEIQRHVCRVPLLIRYPWETDRIIQGPVSIISLFNNIVEVSNGEHNTVTSDGPVFVEYSGYDEETLIENNVSVDPWSYYQVSCISDNWKLDWRADGATSLHDIEDTGPDRSAEYPEIVEEMKMKIKQEVGEPAELHERLGTGTDLGSIDDATVEHLQSMGYLVGEDA